MSTTPSWLVEAQPGLCQCGCSGRRSRVGFVDKTISGSAGLLRRVMFAEDTATRDGVLQRIDARVKIVTMVGLLVTASLVHHVAVIGAVYVLTLPLAVASGIPLAFFVKRVWLFIPVFTGVIVVPAMFSAITPGNIVVPLGTWFGHRVGLTSQGLHAAARIVVRVATSVSLVVLLTLTTPWSRLLAALRALGVPKIFVLVTGMAFRYIFHLLDSITDMYTARKARMVGVASGKQSRVFVAASAGALFGKAHGLSEEVYAAMLSRGYTGNPRTLDTFRLGGRDVLWITVATLLSALILWSDHALVR